MKIEGIRLLKDVVSVRIGHAVCASRRWCTHPSGWGRDIAEFDKKRTEPEEVAKVILKALSADKPKRRYSVGHMAGAAALLESLPQPLADSILKARFSAPYCSNEPGAGGTL